MSCMLESAFNLAAFCASLPVKSGSPASNLCCSNSVLHHLSPCFCLYYRFFFCSLIRHLHCRCALLCCLTLSRSLLLPRLHCSASLSSRKVLDYRDKACCSLALSSHPSTTRTQRLLLLKQRKQREESACHFIWPISCKLGCFSRSGGDSKKHLRMVMCTPNIQKP